MKILKMRYLIIFFFLFGQIHAQSTHVALVFFEQEDLRQLIESIIIENKDCKEGIWYVEIKNSSNFLLSKSFLPNLMKQSSIKNMELYMTTLGNKIVFILTDKNFDLLFTRTFFRSELPEFSELDYVYFYNFSYWHLQKINDEFEVVEEKIYNCK